MRRIYHLVPRRVWETNPGQPYRAASLDTEGFIHCSNADQVARSANRFCAGEADLLVLAIDADRLGPLLKDEAGGDELFPHIYGPLDRSLVVAVRPMKRGGDGLWTFEE
jgi:uncharacterized protein (DUF952 family)